MKTKKQKQSLKGRLHASLTGRITLWVLILFLVAGLVCVALFGFLGLRRIYEDCREIGEEYCEQLQDGRLNEEQLQKENIALVVYETVQGEEIYRIGRLPSERRVGKWYWEDFSRLYCRYEERLVWYEAECEATVWFSCKAQWKDLRGDVLGFAGYYFLLATLMVIFFYFVVRTVFRPIEEMSQKVNRLNLQNIHEERLLVEKSKDELKELAEGINRMLDRMEETYDAQKQFVSEASHELRTPITVLQGFSSMLRRWGASDPDILAESVEAIEGEAKSMQELVEKLLFLSRHERRKLPFSKEWFDMAELIREMEKETVYMSEERNFSCPVCDSVRVYGDRQALKQAFRVFLDNAVKYTEKGDTITLSCKNRNGACEITIQDTGFGMQEKDLEGIFGRFFRADTVRGKNIEGHGLGLSIARLIVDAHAGKITVTTQYTKGSSFTVTLPRQRGV